MGQSNSDLHNNVDQMRVIGPVAIGANGTVTGKIIDRRGFGGVEFVAQYGAIVTTGSVVTLVAFEGDVTGTMTSVADADLLGTEALASRLGGATTSGTGSNVAKRLGYKGNKRYVRVDAVKTGTTSVGCVSVTALLFNPSLAPQANP
jgi:hypothetical protein